MYNIFNIKMKEDYELFEKFIISKYDINNIHNHYKLIKLMKNNVVYLENKYNERVLRNKYNITIQCLDSNLLINIINYFPFFFICFKPV